MKINRAEKAELQNLGNVIKECLDETLLKHPEYGISEHTAQRIVNSLESKIKRKIRTDVLDLIRIEYGGQIPEANQKTIDHLGEVIAQKNESIIQLTSILREHGLIPPPRVHKK
jgi:hypothetical protein